MKGKSGQVSKYDLSLLKIYNLPAMLGPRSQFSTVFREPLDCCFRILFFSYFYIIYHLVSSTLLILFCFCWTYQFHRTGRINLPVLVRSFVCSFVRLFVRLSPVCTLVKSFSQNWLIFCLIFCRKLS